MIDLEFYVNKECLVQFRDGNTWLAVHDDQGRPGLTQVQRSNGDRSFVPIPMLIGAIVKVGEGYAMRVNTNDGAVLGVGLNPDIIATITVVVEPSSRLIKTVS